MKNITIGDIMLQDKYYKRDENKNPSRNLMRRIFFERIFNF